MPWEAPRGPGALKMKKSVLRSFLEVTAAKEEKKGLILLLCIAE